MKNLTLAFLLAGSAFAANATYTFTGTATGTLNGTPFTNAAFTVQGVGDPTTVNCGFVPTCVLNLASGSSSFTVTNIGTGTFAVATYFKDAQQLEATGPPAGGPPAGAVIFGTGTTGDVISLYGELIGNATFGSYNLQSAIGPIGPEAADATVSAFVAVPTSAGNLTLTNLTSFSFQMTPGGTTPTSPPATPAPSTFILMGTGFAAVALWNSAGWGNPRPFR